MGAHSPSGRSPQRDVNKQHAITELSDRTRHDGDFYALLLGAILLALGAIFTDSIPVLIASMIVAPLAYPILGLGLGIVTSNGGLAFRAIGLLLGSCLIALTLAMLATLFFGEERVADTYISFNNNHYIAFVLAMVAGGIAAFGLLRPKVSSAITGVAIAVSLLPPLVDTGVSLAPGGSQSQVPFLLFCLNVAGILLASIIVFWLAGMRSTYRKSIPTD